MLILCLYPIRLPPRYRTKAVVFSFSGVTEPEILNQQSTDWPISFLEVQGSAEPYTLNLEGTVGGGDRIHPGRARVGAADKGYI